MNGRIIESRTVQNERQTEVNTQLDTFLNVQYSLNVHGIFICYFKSEIIVIPRACTVGSMESTQLRLRN